MVDGCFRCSRTLELFPGLTEQDFLSTPEGGSASLLVKNAEFHSYRVEMCKILGRRFIVTAFFRCAVLAEAHLYPMAAGEVAAGWDSFSEARERQKKFDNDKWLELVLGTSGRTFEWGSVESVLDPRVGASEIIIRYS